MAAVTMPGWSEVPPTSDTSTAGAAPPAATSPAPVPVAVAPPAPAAPIRPAHLNLDLRHNFRSVDLSVTVDDKRVLDSKLEGAGKKFGVFGRRGDRSFTRSLDLEPGVRVVGIRVRSAEEKFDHTRVERFDLGSAAVAAMRITVDKTGLDVMTDRPPAPPPATVAATTVVTPSAAAALPLPPSSQTAAFVGEVYQTTRSVLIAIAGFVASAATGFMVQEFMRSRRGGDARHTDGTAVTPPRRRRRDPNESSIGIDAGLS